MAYLVKNTVQGPDLAPVSVTLKKNVIVMTAAFSSYSARLYVKALG